LIVVDSVRADHVSAYGYARNTTPNLDALIADQGVRFQQAISISPWTCPSNASLLTGRIPTAVGSSWDTVRNTLPQAETTLGELLQQGDYYTAGFVNCYCTKGALGFAQGFDHFDETLSDHRGDDKARAAEVNARVVDWLDNQWLPQSNVEGPLFMFIYYFDPHVWYDPPPPYNTLFDPNYGGTFDGRVYQDGKDVVLGRIMPSERDVEHLLALYDGEIAYWDAEFGRLMQHLQGAGMLENTLIIVTADHGELFGEHGEWTHGNALYEEVIRIPLVARYNGVIEPGTVIEMPVQNIDLMPTILDFAGMSIPAGLHSISLRPFLDGDALAVAREIYSELDGITDRNSDFYWLAPRTDLRSIQRDDWKLVHHVGDKEADELFLLRPSLPYERDNLVLPEADRATEMRQTLIDWFGLPDDN
jgi:arylsulfatase A-like enzyme